MKIVALFIAALLVSLSAQAFAQSNGYGQMNQHVTTQRNFQVTGPSGQIEMYGSRDNMGNYNLQGSSGQFLGTIDRNGTMMGPSGEYQGQVRNY